MISTRRRAGLLLTLSVLPLLTASVRAQESGSAEPIPIDLRLTLVEISERLTRGVGEDALEAPPPAVLAGAEVELESALPGGGTDIARTTADDGGAVRFRFDARVPGSPYTLTARTADGTVYISKPQSMASIEESVSLFPLRDDPTGIDQRMMITAARRSDDGSKIRVQQLVSFQAQFLHAHRSAPEVGGGGIVFPIPRGARLNSLSFREEPVSDLTVQDFGERGTGVLIPETIFPNDRGFLEGEYELDVAEGSVFLLDLHRWYDIVAFFLFLAEGDLSVAWSEAGTAIPDGLQPLGSQVLQAEAEPFLHYQDAGRAPAGSSMGIPVRYDPGATPDVPPPREMRLELQLIDISGLIEASPEHGQQMPDPALFVLRNATAELSCWTLEGERETVTATADRNGFVIFELGLRNPGSPFSVTARAPGAGDAGEVFISKEEQLGPRAGRFNMYRTTDDHGKLTQQLIMKIVTVIPGQDEGADEKMVQVRQIAPVVYDGVAAYTGPPGAEGAGLFFPVPAGATVTSLRFQEDDVLDLTAREVEHWGYGVPIPGPVFPLTRGSLIGTYVQTVREGEVLDLGFSAVVDTGAFQVAYEEGAFSLDAELTGEWGSPLLSEPRTQQMPDVGRTVVVHSSNTPVPAHETVRIPIRFGPPPVSTRTILVTALILLSFAAPVVGGLWVARRRDSAAGLVARRSRLEALHRAGELSEEDYRAELARIDAIAAGPPTDPGSSGAPTAPQLQESLEVLERSLPTLPPEAAEHAEALLRALQTPRVSTPDDRGDTA